MKNFSLWGSILSHWLLVLLIILISSGASYWLFRSRSGNQAYGSMTVTVQGSRNYPNTNQLVLQPGAVQDIAYLTASSQAWITDPVQVQKVVEQAELSVSDASLKGLTKLFRVVAPSGASNYQVQFEADSTDEVNRAFTALKNVMTELKNGLNQMEGAELRMNLAFSDPVITVTGNQIPLTPLAGLLVGIILGLVVAVAIDGKKA